MAEAVDRILSPTRALGFFGSLTHHLVNSVILSLFVPSFIENGTGEFHLRNLDTFPR
jgi:hypothetical protein